MEAKAGINSGRSRLLRWWMILACLLASWLSWWGLNKWLEPKPLWSSTLPDGLCYYPLHEEKNGSRIVAQVIKPKSDGALRPTPALAVLDKRNGQELHRTEIREKFSFFDGEEQFQPRIHGDVVWYLARDSSSRSLQYRLCSWNLKTGRLNEHVQTWQNHPFHFDFSWPIESRIMVIRSAMPKEALCIAWGADPRVTLILSALCNRLLITLPIWYESYTLSADSDSAPKFLAHWSPPKSHWHYGHELSRDGLWDAYPEPWGDCGLAYQRAKATGRTIFHGQELFDLFRSPETGLLIYNTTTGKLIHHYQDQSAHQSTNGWLGNYLAVTSFHPDKDKQLSLDELRQGAENVNLNLYSKTFRAEHHVLRREPDGIHRLSKPESLANTRISAYFGTLNGFEQVYQGRIYSELKIKGNEIVMQRNKCFDWEALVTMSRWVPNTNQYLVSSLPAYFRWMHRLEEKWTWLEPIFHSLRKWIGVERQISVVDEGPNGTRESTFVQTFIDMWPGNSSQLWLMQFNKQGESMESVTLGAYTLPMAISSPWWGRAAAILPILLLIAFLVRCFRFQLTFPAYRN